MHEELVAEHLDRRMDRRWDRRTEHADGGLLRGPGQTRRDVVARVEQEVDILLTAFAALDAGEDPLEPPRTLAAGRALPTGLACEELGDPPGGPDRAGVIVHHHDRARAEHRAGLGHLVLAEGEVDLVGAEPGCRHPARDERLQRPVVTDAAAERGMVDEVGEGRLDHLELVHPGTVDVSGQREQPGPRRTSLAETGERGAAVPDDPGEVGHGLHVVHDSRLAVEADRCREVRRLDPGEAPLALERLEQRCLLAADVGAGPRVDHDVDGEARAEDVGAHRPMRVRVVERCLHAFEPEGELTADVDERLGDLQGVGGDHHAFDQLVWVALDQQVVLEGRRLALVPVHHQIGHRVLAQHRPFASRGEAGTPAAEQARRVDLVCDRFGVHRERLAEAFVATGREEALEGMGVLVVEPGGDDLRRVGRRHDPPPLDALEPASASAARRACASALAARSDATRAGSATSPTSRTTRLSEPWEGISPRARPRGARRSARRRTRRSGHRRSGG